MHKCKHGATVDGVWVTGPQYFYLNYWKIKDRIPVKRQLDREIAMMHQMEVEQMNSMLDKMDGKGMGLLNQIVHKPKQITQEVIPWYTITKDGKVFQHDPDAP
jgi:hypothetical protein